MCQSIQLLISSIDYWSHTYLYSLKKKGASPILPWGLCQNWCLRKQVKQNLKEKYPKYIPLVDPVDASVEVRQRIAYLETFLKDYVIEVDVIEEVEDVVEDNALTAAEKDELATGSRQSLTPDDEEWTNC